MAINFCYLKKVGTFEVLTVRCTLISRRAAVNLLKTCLGFFYAQMLRYWRLSIRSHCFVLRDKVCRTVSSVCGSRFLFAYND